MGTMDDDTDTVEATTTALLSNTTNTTTTTTTSNKTVDSTWNIPGLKKEVARLILRSHKKIGKTSQKLHTAQATVTALRNNNTSTVSLEQLEQCPDVETLEAELQELQQKLQQLNVLENALATMKKKEAVLPIELATLAISLHVPDQPPSREPRGPGKSKVIEESVKNANAQRRLPYRRYYSFQNIEIRVGKQAVDNDELSLNPQHRDGADWWMHASGCPGSHVVIRCHDETLPSEVVQDAAALAARQSKCQGTVIKVSLTRCRDVKKPPGAKAGLVQLTGKVRTVTVDMREAQQRLERLEKTALIN